ncbi:MAG: NAD(P)H-hydrate dehydratase, partial [Muribaculaceae bacterium]|nr:NAD(P)H-hydrate dehydratase [Muribaculaceae bacterium]
PGIGVSSTTINAVEAFFKMSTAKHHPLVIDADALNCIAERPIMMNYVPPLSVLTPHTGEFDRIFGSQPSAEARLRKALEIAAYHNIILVIKGHYTAVVRPDGKVHINSSGTPALATPGSGDVLTGVITALIAQGYTPETAAIVGVYVHGMAGQIAEEKHGEYGVTASDIADNIGKSIKTIMG